MAPLPLPGRKGLGEGGFEQVSHFGLDSTMNHLAKPFVLFCGKTMKTLRFALISFCFFSIATCFSQITIGPQGQQRHTSPVKPRSTEARMAEFAKKLSLTVDQKNKITKLVNMQVERLKILAKNTKISDSDRKSKIAADRALVNKQIRVLLNKKQQKTFDAMLAEDAKKRQKMGQTSTKPPRN